MIYLVHFERPYKHARHYLGFTDLTLTERFKRHTSNAAKRQGSALMRAITEAGIGFKIVRLWPGPRNWCSQCGQKLSARACGPTHAVLFKEWQDHGRMMERRLKSGGHSRRCPVCQGRIDYESLQCKLKTEVK